MEKEGLIEMGVSEKAEERGFSLALVLGVVCHSAQHLSTPSIILQVLIKHLLCWGAAVGKTGSRQTAARAINNNQTQGSSAPAHALLPCSLLPSTPFHPRISASVAFLYLLKAGILDCCWPERRAVLAPDAFLHLCSGTTGGGILMPHALSEAAWLLRA